MDTTLLVVGLGFAVFGGIVLDVHRWSRYSINLVLGTGWAIYWAISVILVTVRRGLVALVLGLSVLAFPVWRIGRWLRPLLGLPSWLARRIMSPERARKVRDEVVPAFHSGTEAAIEQEYPESDHPEAVEELRADARNAAKKNLRTFEAGEYGVTVASALAGLVLISGWLGDVLTGLSLAIFFGVAIRSAVVRWVTYERIPEDDEPHEIVAKWFWNARVVGGTVPLFLLYSFDRERIGDDVHERAIADFERAGEAVIAGRENSFSLAFAKRFLPWVVAEMRRNLPDVEDPRLANGLALLLGVNGRSSEELQ